ncbi:molybdate ABC transporter substrate-binding protein [Shigella sonnei]
MRKSTAKTGRTGYALPETGSGGRCSWRAGVCQTNEAPLGIVYGSDAVASKGVKVVATFPEDSHKKVEYPVAVVEGHNNATVKAFYDYLKGPQAAEIFKRYGFTTK